MAVTFTALLGPSLIKIYFYYGFSAETRRPFGAPFSQLAPAPSALPTHSPTHTQPCPDICLCPARQTKRSSSLATRMRLSNVWVDSVSITHKNDGLLHGLLLMWWEW
jgi:hypothetical protein